MISVSSPMFVAGRVAHPHRHLRRRDTSARGGVLSPNVRSWLTTSSAPGPATSVTFGLLGSGIDGKRLELHRVLVVHVDGLERADQRVHVVAGQRAVGLDVAQHVVGDLDGEERVAQALADRDARELADEVLLARDAVEVGAHVEQPPAQARLLIEDRAVRVEDLHVARPHVFERLAAVERVRTRDRWGG